MNARFLPALLTVVVFCSTSGPLLAVERSAHDDYSTDSMALDAIIARPLCLAATIIGTGLFIASLPITVISGSTHQAARTLVGKPANLLFTRKLGHLSAVE